MKKLLSFLVLMLIALTLFVGCDTNTPTKDNSSNGGTNTPVEKPEEPDNPGTEPDNPGTEPDNPGTEPDNPGEGNEELPHKNATTTEAEIVNNIFNTISYLKYLQNNLPDGVTENSNTFYFEQGSSFDVYKTDNENKIVLDSNGKPIKCFTASFIGSAKQVLDYKNLIITFTCNLEEGTKFNESAHSVEGEVVVKIDQVNMTQTYDFKKVIIDNHIIDNLNNMFNQSVPPEPQTEA